MVILAGWWLWVAVPGGVQLERSYWVHASLAHSPLKKYWGANFPPSEPPAREEVRNACALLTGEYAANRLYLIYHQEIPLNEAKRVFTWWREFCPPETEIVPTLVLEMYDQEGTEVFLEEVLHDLGGFLRADVNRSRIGVYDVYPGRNQGTGPGILAALFPHGTIRVGIQPEEELKAPFCAAVQDTWSGICLGTTHEHWKQEGFGRDLLRQWVAVRNRSQLPIVWDLIAVAWDYSATEDGRFPGYDDADRNMPLAAGRNLLAAQEILSSASKESFGGFSSDLFILHVNSKSDPHDGRDMSFYDVLKRGEIYRGYYAEPFREIVTIYQALEQGRDIMTLTLPSSLPEERKPSSGPEREP
jgi:hypothetical protein